MSDRSAILAAGHGTCPRCGEISWPADACWLTDDLVLVRFVPGCTHVVGEVGVVSQSARRIDPRCKATTARGTRCRNASASDTGGWCAIHAPANEGRTR